MEDAMSKCLVTIIGALGILSGSLLPIDSAQAGASASAPSKYAHANQVASASQSQVSTNRAAHKPAFAITEYSSSSARTPKH
jgi:hypothetical protein